MNKLVYERTPRSWYKATSSYEEVANPDEWLECPNCHLKPLVWTFDNGRYTACGCGEDDYNHHHVSAECIGSVLKRTGGFKDHDSDGLRKNWNHWVRTGEYLFIRDFPNTGRW